MDPWLFGRNQLTANVKTIMKETDSLLNPSIARIYILIREILRGYVCPSPEGNIKKTACLFLVVNIENIGLPLSMGPEVDGVRNHLSDVPTDAMPIATDFSKCTSPDTSEFGSTI